MRFFGLLIALAAAVNSVANAQTLADLSPASREAFDRGVAAAQRQEWDLAAKHFGAIREKRVLPPAVPFNLAVANARAGREVPAIAWYSAYLVLAPSASNAPAVRKEIAALEVSAESKSRRLLEEAIRAAERIPDATKQRSALYTITGLIAKAGQEEWTVRMADRLSINEKRDALLRLLGETLAHTGEVEAAKRVAARIRDPFQREWVQMDLHWYLSDIDEVEAALREAANIEDAKLRADQLKGIAHWGGTDRVRPVERPWNFERPDLEIRVRLNAYEGYRRQGMTADAERIMAGIASGFDWAHATKMDDRYILAVADFLAARGDSAKSRAVREMHHAGTLQVWIDWSAELDKEPVFTDLGGTIKRAGEGATEAIPIALAQAGCRLSKGVLVARRLRTLTQRGLYESSARSFHCLLG